MKKLWNARHCLKLLHLLLVVAILTLPCSVAWGGMGSGGGGMGGSGGGGGGMGGGGSSHRSAGRGGLQGPAGDAEPRVPPRA